MNTLDYCFTFNIDVEGMCVAQAEGIASVEPHGEGWRIASIVLDGRDMANLSSPHADVALPETHWLYQKIRLMLLSRPTRSEIDLLWDNRGREAA